MDNNEKIQLFMDRFVHDNSLFAEQVYFADRGVIYYPMREGECSHKGEHPKKDCPDIINLTFNEKYLLRHLQGKSTYAPYQISDEETVKWVCLDFDTDNGKEEIQSFVAGVCKELDTLLPGGYLLEASGSKGYHLWFFFREPLEIAYAHAFGNALADDMKKDMPATINIEVYPKQATRTLYGNTVKPPLGIHRKTKNRCWLLDPSSFEKYEDQWEALKDVKTIKNSWVKARTTPTSTYVPETSAPWAPYCLSDIMEKGTTAGFKDEPAFKIACYLKAKGIPRDLAETLMDEWNKKNNPPIDQHILNTKIVSAYSGNYSWRPCGLQSFDHVCHSSCPFFADKVKYRWGNRKGDPKGVISID